MLFVAFPFLLLIFPLCVSFLIFWLICNLGVFHLEFILFWSLWVSWTWVAILGKFLTIISSSIYSCPFFVFSWDTYDSNVGVFNTVPNVSAVVLIYFYSFFFFSALLHLFPPSIFHLTYLFFCLNYSTIGFLQSVFNLSYCAVHYWLTLLCFFQVLVKHFLHLLNLCLYLSVAPFCFQEFGSALLSLFWILFQVDSLSPPLLIWWVIIMFLHLLDISLPFHLV